jgi:pimeloyl-ACP methyl ester carboxylesterase
MNDYGIFRMNPVMRFALSLAMALYIILAITPFILAGLLLVHGETCQGRLFASAVIAGLLAPVALWFAAYRKRKRGTLTASACLGGLALLLLGINYLLTSDGQPLADSSAKSYFTGATAYRRASMANLVPEMDQLLLGTYVIPGLDSLMDKPNTLELRTQVREVYGEMRRSAEFECLGSVMNHAYRDIFLRDPVIGHFYEYIPKGASRERMPVVIFLHGSLGNFRGYLWVWKRIADTHGFAIVAPTFGAGNWDASGGEAAIEQARQYCVSNPRLDPSRIFLAGLSNGGRGVCLGARRSPNAYRGLILISPVLDTEVLLKSSFVQAWKDKPILVLHGTADNRIPVRYIRGAIALMSGAGMRVDDQIYDGQTHFLFFTMRTQVQDRIGNWLTMARAFECSKLPQP